MVKYYPSVVVLGGIRALAHVEPADPLRQDQDGRERRGRHHVGGALSGDPLQAHEQRELALHGGRERQRMPQKVQHCLWRPRLPCMGTSVAIRWVRYDAAAALRHIWQVRKSTPGVPKPRSAMSVETTSYPCTAS